MSVQAQGAVRGGHGPRAKLQSFALLFPQCRRAPGSSPVPAVGFGSRSTHCAPRLPSYGHAWVLIWSCYFWSCAHCGYFLAHFSLPVPRFQPAQEPAHSSSSCDAEGLQSWAQRFSSTNDSEGGRIYSCNVLRGGEKRANDQIKIAKSLPFDPDTGWGILSVKFSPLDLFLCHLPGFLIILFMGGGCVCQKHLQCNYPLLLHPCQWNAVPILSAPLWSPGPCESWIQWGRKDQNWNTTALDSGTSELPLALLSKNRSAACSSLSYSSSLQLGCFPLPYFGMEIRLSQSEVCQILRKITHNYLGLLLIAAGKWLREELGRAGTGRGQIYCRRELLALKSAFASPRRPSSN